MSKLLDALIEQRRMGVVTYAAYLEKIAKLTKDATTPGGPEAYPVSVNTAAQRALYNNLGKDAGLALTVDAAIQGSLQDDWRNSSSKTKKVRNGIKAALESAFAASEAAGFTGVRQRDDRYSVEAETTRILELAKHQNGY